MDMSNACYYTFSTISQTLAGAFGILVVVTLYRMDTINAFLKLLSDGQMSGYIDTTESMRIAARVEADFLRVADELRKMKSNPPSGWDEARRDRLSREVDRYCEVASRLRFLKKGLKVSLLATGFTIAYSLIFLPLTPWVAKSHLAACLSIGIDLAAAGFCLSGYYKLAIGVTE